MEKKRISDIDNKRLEIPCKKTRFNLNEDNSSLVSDDIHRRRIQVLSLKEFCEKSISRYNILQKYPTLHMFSIVRQTIIDLIDIAVCGGDTISADESCFDSSSNETGN